MPPANAKNSWVQKKSITGGHFKRYSKNITISLQHAMICPSRHTIFVYKYSYKYVYNIILYIIISWLNPSAFPKNLWKSPIGSSRASTCWKVWSTRRCNIGRQLKICSASTQAGNWLPGIIPSVFLLAVGFCCSYNVLIVCYTYNIGISIYKYL